MKNSGEVWKIQQDADTPPSTATGPRPPVKTKWAGLNTELMKCRPALHKGFSGSKEFFGALGDQPCISK